MKRMVIPAYILICLFSITIHSQEKVPEYLLDVYAPFLLQEEDVNVNFQSTSDSILTVLGRWPWGICIGVNTVDNYIYMGNGPTLHILDVSNPATPRIVGEYLTKGLIGHIEIKDQLGYISTGGAMEIFDLSNPQNPVKLGEALRQPGTTGPLRIAVEGNLAFVTTWGLLWVVDVSDPVNPFYRGVVAAGGDIPRCLAAKGAYAYVGNPEWPNLIIVDATNPDRLDWAGELDIGGWGESAQVKDTLLYVGVRGFENDLLVIYSVSSPASPQKVGEIVIPKTNSCSIVIQSLTVAGNIAYLATDLAGIFAIDVTNPASPVILDNIRKPNESLRFGTAITYARGNLFAAYSSGLWMVDATQPASLKDLNFFPTCETANKVAVKEDLAFIACGYSGLWILDISDPFTPRQIANLNTGGWAADVVVSDQSAYVVNYGLATGDTTRGLWVIDISDINRPQTLGHHIGISQENHFSSHHNSLAVSGNLVFMTAANWPHGDSLLEIIDVSDPQNPHTKSIFQAPYRVYHIALQDSFAFLACPDSGLVVVYWRDVDNLVKIAQIPGWTAGIALRNYYAYAISYALSSPQLRIFDVSNPHNPTLSGFTNTLNSTLDIFE